MIRNILKGFTEPKAEPLFSIEIELDPYSENVLQEGHQDVTVRFDGSVYTGGKYAGEIPCWNYITQFDKPKSMKRIAFNRFTMDVRGEADQTLIAEPVANFYLCPMFCPTCLMLFFRASHFAVRNYDQHARNAAAPRVLVQLVASGRPLRCAAWS